MKNRLKYILLILLTVVSSFGVAENYYFDQISLNQGLSQSTVKVVFRDHIGLLWIGTKDGLNRYDGAQIRTYRSENGKEHTLPNNNIFFIAEDAMNNLWIGTGGSLCRYDRQNDAFIPEKIQGKDISLRNILVTGNYLYATTTTAILTYDCRNNSWKERPFTGEESNISQASKLEKGTGGKILIGSRWKGLFECDPGTGKLNRTTFFKGQNVLDIYRDPQNRLWISEFGKGVFCFDTRGKLLHDLSKADPRFRNDQVMDIIQHQGRMWLVTDGNGILVYSPQQNEFEKKGHDQDNPFSLPVNSYLSIYADKYDNLWLGSIRGGLIGVRNVHIQSYQNAPLNSTFGVSEQTILSFFEDADGMIWIGTDGEGLNLYNPVTRKFRHFPSTYGKKVSSITNFSDRELLISLYKEGLKLFNKQTGSLMPFKMPDAGSKSLILTDWIGVSVWNGGHGNIYFSDEKVYTYTPATQQVSEIKVTGTGEGAVRFYMSALLPGRLLLCSNATISILNLSTNRIEAKATIDQDKLGVINSVEIDKSGLVWLGVTSGLYTLNLHTKALTRIKPNLINSVSILAFDKKESLWIGSGLEMYRYSITGQELIRYRKADGVNTNEYLPKSRLCSRSGDIYLGGVSGFCRIDANIPFKRIDNPVFELLDIQLDGSLLPGERISLKKGISSVRIPWNYTSLVVNIFMNTNELSSVKRARYLISGFSDKYYELEKQSVDLQALPPGTYTLQVQTELKNESWSDPVNLLNISVTPPWWQTWWFFLLVIALILFALFRIRQLAIKKTMQDMEKEMQTHERDLSEQKIRFLINISHELRTPLTLVYAPLRRLLKDEKTPEQLKPLLTLMYKHVKNMKNMIDMVLDVRKMEMKLETLNKQPYRLNDWMQGVVDDFAFEFRAKQVKLITEPDEQIQTVRFDRGLCDKVLSNLLMNAIKFSDAGSCVIVRSELIDDKVRIAVLDQGMGVNPEDVPNLFTRFYQAKHEKGGTGIGLSYAKAQVELHGGTIGYRPLVPTGSEFWFELPLDLQQDTSTTAFEQIMFDIKEREMPDSLSVGEAVDFKKLTVLIAEDEPDLLAYMHESLSDIFKQVIVARNGDEALKKVYTTTPDLVISDVMMPVMDGFELCRSLKMDVTISHIPVILLTALGDDDSSLTGYKMGADLYLSKPFGVDILMAILGNLFRTRNELKKQYALPEQTLSTQEITFSNADERFMTKLLVLIEERLDDPDLRIDELAVEMAMSRTSFYNKVKLVTGISANAFIVDYKVKKAIQQLRSTDLPIQEISMQLGFVSQRYFSTVFKQVTGKTPTQYRSEG